MDGFIEITIVDHSGTSKRTIALSTIATFERSHDGTTEIMDHRQDCVHVRETYDEVKQLVADALDR